MTSKSEEIQVKAYFPSERHKHLGLMTPGPLGPDISPELYALMGTPSHKIQSTGETTAPSSPFTHFITMCFPANAEYKIKHKEYKANGMIVMKFDKVKFGSCDQEEQYQWINWKMHNHFKSEFDKVDAFFEQTKIGNLHIHMRVKSNTNIKHMRCFLHRIYETDSKYIRFVDIKKYDDGKWNDYQNKQENKEYQKTTLKNFII